MPDSGIPVAPPDAAACLRLLLHERERLQKAGVSHIAIFGSTARNAARPQSDVDILVDFDPGVRLDLVDLVDLRDRLAQIVGRNVDLVSRRALRPEYDAEILDTAVYAF